jgi:multicomponent Na+:H+ antiporter subunit A
MPAPWSDPITLLVLAAGVAAPLTFGFGLWKTRLAIPVGLALTAVAFFAALWGATSPCNVGIIDDKGCETIDLAWAPAWDLRFVFALDGLGALYALLATGVGIAVVIYSAAYLPIHLHHGHRSEREIVPFLGWLLLFMGAMVGLVLSRDLLLLFVFWDITAIASFFLIGFDRTERDARVAAFMAMVTTGVSAIALLVAILLIHRETGTFALDDALRSLESGRSATIAGVLIAIAGLAKSAQVPLHYWLPRAMAAPTPVSAYLHSAAMVAAGVFLLSRLHPVLVLSDGVLDLLLVVGFVSMAVGGVIALTRDRLKQLLAYSTISQYGYVVVLLGLGSDHAVVAACFYVVAHAVAKSALFLTAGTVTEATGTASLAEIGGLARRMPLLAVASGIAAASLAALPGTAGFFKDELFFASAHERGGIVPILAVAGAALTAAYMGRFWFGIFTGSEKKAPGGVPAALVWPIVALSIVSVIGGFWVAPVRKLAENAAGSVVGGHPHVHAGYVFSLTTENTMAIVAIASGAILLATQRWWIGALRRVVGVGEIIGAERLFNLSIGGLNHLSDRAYRIEVRDLRSRVASILPPAALLIGLGLFFSRHDLQVTVGPFDRDDLVIAAMLAVAAIAALAATARDHHLTLSLVLSGVGFSLAVVYALLGAPDVALVAVLVETLFTLLFLGMLALMPRDINPSSVQPFHDDDIDPAPETHRRRDIAIAGIGGLLAFAIAWTTLSEEPATDGVAAEYIGLTPLAHGKDIVTVILADFRGFDTLGEITVIGIAFLGIATLLRRWRTLP